MSFTPSNKIFLGSIPNSWNLENLKSVVCGSGRIVEVRCLMEQPNRNKGYGFVEYATPEDALNALPLLSLIRIAGSHKQMRVELSKEGSRTDGKPILNLNYNYLPSNVILPDELQQRSQYNQAPASNYADSSNILDGLPPEFVQMMTTNTQFQQTVTQMINNGFDLDKILELTRPFLTAEAAPQPPATLDALATAPLQALATPSATPASHNDAATVIPDFLKNASSYLPQPPANALSAESVIDQSLKKFDPPLLIQLITNLKEVVDVSNPHNAAQVVKEAPDLALASAQLLLLMGFIDADVIQEAMLLQTTTLPQAATLLPQNPYPPPAGNGFGGQRASFAPPPPPVTTSQQNIDPNWAGLGPRTVERLLKLDKTQADMILQVLKMSADQVYLLPADQRAMVEQLRTEYL